MPVDFFYIDNKESVLPEFKIKVMAFNSAAVIALGIVASIVTSTLVASSAYRSKYSDAERAQRSIVVKGKSTQVVKSDQGNWSIFISGTGKTIQEAHGILDSGVAKVLLFLADRGFSSSEIGYLPIYTTVHYDRDDDGNKTRDIVEYELNQKIQVSTSNVEFIADAAGEVTDLLREGVLVSGGKPLYTYSKVSEAKLNIIAKAAANARKRAEEIAKNAGGSITEIKDIRQGVIQITKPNSTEVSSYGINDTSTIGKDISVVVTVEFGISDS